MNRSEFLNGLREALKNDLTEKEVQENVQYYKTYIEEEVRNGRAEAEVMDELGDPWLIAKTIMISPGTKKGYDNVNDSYVGEQRQVRNAETKVHVFGLDSWWKKLLAIVVVVVIVLGIISVITGIVALVLPIVVPVLCIMLVVQIFSNRNR